MLEFRFTCIQARGLLDKVRYSYETRHELARMGVRFCRSWLCKSSCCFKKFTNGETLVYLPKQSFVILDTAQWSIFTTATTNMILTMMLIPRTVQAHFHQYQLLVCGRALFLLLVNWFHCSVLVIVFIRMDDTSSNQAMPTIISQFSLRPFYACSPRSSRRMMIPGIISQQSW